MATSAFVPGAGGNSGEMPDRGVLQALAQAQEEATTLRSVLAAISDALAAANARLDALEAQVGVESGDDGYALIESPSLLSPPMAPSHGSPRAGGWKVPGWSSSAETMDSASGDVVSGETLRLRREALGISQAAVAHAAHCSRGLVAEVERGKRRSAQTLAHLASVLDRLEQQARRN